MKVKILYLLTGIIGGMLLGILYVKTTEVKEMKFALNKAYFPLPQKTYQWTGFAKEVGENYVIAEFDVIVRRYPTIKQPNNRELRTIKLIVDKETKILKFGKAKEQPDGAGGVTLVSSELPASLNEIKAGDYLDVTIDGDFKTAKEARASKILIVGQ